MIALLLLAEGDAVLRSRHVLRALLCFPPMQGPIVVRALWLGWTLLLFRHLGECRGLVVPHGGGGGGGGGGECYDLPGSVVSPVDVASLW